MDKSITGIGIVCAWEIVLKYKETQLLLHEVFRKILITFKILYDSLYAHLFIFRGHKIC